MAYKTHLLEEIFICTKHLGFSYGDVMKMPTYERRFFIVTLQNQVNEAKESNENPNKVVKTGKFTRTRTMSAK